MSQITVKNVFGEDAGKVDLDAATFGIEPNVAVMHQVVTAQLAARRSGSQSTKTRSEVRGGGAKPWRQKGTGNARQGSIRSPQFVGGGVAHGPKPRKYGQKTPKKMIGLALRSALSDRANEGKIIVVDSWGWDKPSTKSAKSALADLGITGGVLVVVDRDDAAAALSFRNLPEVQLVNPAELNAYDVLCNETIVFTQDTLPKPTTGTAAKRSEADRSDSAAPAVQSFANPDAPDEGSASDESDGGSSQSEAEASPDHQNRSASDESDGGSSQSEAEASPDHQNRSAGDESDGGSSRSEAEASHNHPYGAGSHAALLGGAQPEGYPIKGNADSMLYHVPGSSFYGRTVAEVWFDAEAVAQSAGFARPDSQAGDDAANANDVAEAASEAVPVQPHGDESYVALADDAQPEGYPIKGNADSMLYHMPDSAFFDRTIAEVWFSSASAAEAAGFSKPRESDS